MRYNLLKVIHSGGSMYHIIIEQTREYENRMEYDEINRSFYASEYRSLMNARGVTFPYGWIDESGNPPNSHLDVFLVSKEDYKLGEKIEIKIIGCFMRADGDNKLVGVLPQRAENDLFELPTEEIAELKKLYPVINKNEGWLGKEVAEKIINNYLYSRKDIHMEIK